MKTAIPKIVLAIFAAAWIWLSAGAPLAAAWEPPDDPYFKSAGAWGQAHDDQWALKRIGFTAGAESAWRLLRPEAQPVIVAVIDTGLDWNHLDIARDRLWRNPGEVPDNGIDDDRNGFVDDIIGWNFCDLSNHPWDFDGHGTFVTSVIAAAHGNSAGITGVSPLARIMVLKALNAFGHSRASQVTEAILYAVANGARVINLSVGGAGDSPLLHDAVRYAHAKGVLIVTAAGNEGQELKTQALARFPEVLTVAATDLGDKRTIFSNWGPEVDVAAPGIDILGLRARRTDTMLGIPGVAYQAGAAYVGADRRYYRASGTSFSAPFVSGLASLLLANDNGLTPDDVMRLIKHTARDIDVPGVDQFSGYGLVDASAALKAPRTLFLEAAISGVAVVKVKKAQFVRVTGTADADNLDRAWLELGAGREPTAWKKVSDELRRPLRDGALADIKTSEFQGGKVWMLRLIVVHRNGARREFRFTLDLG